MVGNTDAETARGMRESVTIADRSAADALTLGDIVRDPGLYGFSTGRVLSIDDGLVEVQFGESESPLLVYAADLVRVETP